MLHRDRIRNFTAKEAIFNLLRIGDQLKPLKKSNPEYAELIQYILDNKGKQLSTLKVIGEKTGLKNHILGKKLKELYFLVLEKENFLKFEKVQYELNYRLFNHFYQLKLDYLPVLPNVGDTFESYFLTGIMGMGTFSVKRIWHNLHEGTQIITIDLGRYLPPEQSMPPAD